MNLAKKFIIDRWMLDEEVKATIFLDLEQPCVCEADLPVVDVDEPEYLGVLIGGGHSYYVKWSLITEITLQTGNEKRTFRLK